MSFIKIKDPRKREELIKDFIETRKRIKDNFVAKKVGEIEYQRGLTKLFKPVTETQKATTKEITEAQKATAEKITSELLPIKESIEKIPTITFPVYPTLKMTEEEKRNLGSIAEIGLIGLTAKGGVDRTFGFTPKENKLHIGNKPVTIIDNDIIIEGVKYKGTPGLWELITSQEPQDFTEEDFVNYGELLIQTNTIYQKDDPTQKKTKIQSIEKMEKYY